MIGRTLSHFEITAKIGEGGMGEIYRARDTSLGREVAIKVLPEALTGDPERLQRFAREAKILASLNHPNIATIYEVGESCGVHFLAMELIHGETLAERIARGPVPVDEALSIALEIAQALEAAHQGGIVHRDLKPANVMLGSERSVKVLDFGLAKTGGKPGDTTPDLSRSPTLTAEMTQAGLILGTAAYMSPEQARGEEADQRSDIWAFGTILWEMLTGMKLFDGRTLSDILAAVLTRQPPWEELAEDTPESIARLLRRCLTREPHLRLQHIGDARIEIAEEIDRPPGSTPASPPDAATEARSRALLIGLTAVAAVAVGVAIWSQATGRAAEERPAEPVRLQVVLEPGQRLAGTLSSPVAFSPDGARVVFAAASGDTTQLYRRELSSFDIEPIPDTEGARAPFFSPDGQWIGFVANGKLQKLRLAGGAPLTICDAGIRVIGATWGQDGSIIFTPDVAKGLMKVSAAGGVPEVVTVPNAEDNEVGHGRPQFMPDGRSVLFTVMRSDGFDIGRLFLDSGEWRTIVEDAHWARYLPSGYLIYFVGTDLRAASFDPGKPTQVLSPVSVANAVGAFSTSSTSLVFVPLSGASENTLVWVDRQGATSPVTDDLAPFDAPRLSPDGSQLAINLRSATGTTLWTYDLIRGSRSRLTTRGGINNFATWTPDGSMVTFNSIRSAGGIFQKPADGSGDAVQLIKRTNPQLPSSWSPDGRALAYTELNPDTQEDLWILPAGNPRDPVPLLVTPFRERAPTFSPNGRWLAYTSDESGRDEIYARAYPGPGHRWTLSTDGGGEPVWSRDGSELFYRNGDRMMVVPIESGSELVAGKPLVLFEAPFAHSVNFGYPNYDIAPEGQRFLMIQGDTTEEAVHLNIVLNWLPELERITGAQ